MAYNKTFILLMNLQLKQGLVGLAFFCCTWKSWVGSKARGWKHLRSCSLGKKYELLWPEDCGTLYFAKVAIAIFLVLYSLLEISHSLLSKWESVFFSLDSGEDDECSEECSRRLASFDFRGWAMKGTWLSTCLSQNAHP